MPSNSRNNNQPCNDENHSTSCAPNTAPARPLTFQEEENVLRAAVPEAFDRHGLFDAPSASGLLVHNVVAPRHREMLRNHLERDARQRTRPIPDVRGRLPYEPGPGAMAGLAGLHPAGRTAACGSSKPEADVAPVVAAVLVRQQAPPGAASLASAAPQLAHAAASHTITGPADVQLSRSSSETLWSEADTRRLFSLRAQNVPFKQVAKYFSGKSEKACQEKFYKTKGRDGFWSSFFCDEQKKHRGGRGGRPPPPPPPPPGAGCSS